MSAAEATALLLVADRADDARCQADLERLAAALREQLLIVVEPCCREPGDRTLDRALDACAAAGFARIVALPLLLAATSHERHDLPAVLARARERWPALRFHGGEPLGAQEGLVQALAERAAQACAAGPSTPPAATALALVGRGSADPASNAELARLARLLWERRGYGWVEYGFYGASRPDIADLIARCDALGARQVVVLPALPYTGRAHRRIGMFVEAAQRRHPALPLLLAPHLGGHTGLVAALRQRYEQALAPAAAQTSHTPQPAPTPLRVRLSGHDGPGHSHGSFATASPAAPILPPRYRDATPVSAAPMAAADLVYDAAGRVAWDRIWGQDDPTSPFCDLALAGGPPHRATLLEPAHPAEVAADPEGYRRVQAELARALAMVSGLPVQSDVASGWIGLRCPDERAAIWLLRAIVVENVAVRREGCLLLLPAGPAFRLEGEIRNVVTAVAKCYHYWQEHLSAGQL